MPPRALVRLRGEALVGVRVWRDALSSGEFLTGWSALVSLTVAVTILGPYQHARDLGTIITALLVAVIGWALLTAAMLPVAWAERRLTRPHARVALIVAAIIVGSVARPLLNDAIASQFDPRIVPADMLQRIATNAAAWLPLLSLVAITTVRYNATRLARLRMMTAIATLSDGKRRSLSYAQESRRLVVTSVADLRRQRDELLRRDVIDFGAVRDFSEAVRAASHALVERAQSFPEIVPGDTRDRLPASPVVPFLSRLQAPPMLLVGALYLSGSGPYTYLVGGVPLLATAIAIGLLVTLAADLATRSAARHCAGRTRGRRFIVIWTAAGGAITIAGACILPGHGGVLLIPLIAIPGVAVISALCTDAVQRSGTRAQRLQTVLSVAAHAFAAQTVQAREPLTAAADALHGRVQGRCVMFAAYVDENAPSPEDLDDFRAQTDRALDETLAVADRRAPTPDTLDELLAAWAGILDLTVQISPAARAAITDNEVSHRAARVANEGFVNAVKHSAARTAQVDIDARGQTLLIRIAAPGRLPTVQGRSFGHGISGLGAGTRLVQVGDDVVLFAEVDTTSSIIAARPAVG